jgi:uncharacterized protein DUF4388
VTEDKRDGTFVIDADGRVRLDVAAARRLAAIAGRYQFVPAPPGLLILRRATAAETGEDSHVSLCGEIDARAGVVEMVNLIHSQAWDGTLEVMVGDVHKSLMFSKGNIRAASSNVWEDQIGNILYRFGVISQEALDWARHGSGGDEQRLGLLLVEQGLLTAHELYLHVRKQIEEILFSIIALRDGEFYFYRSPEVVQVGPVNLNTQRLLFEGVRRIDEMGYFREKLPALSVVLEPVVPPPPLKLEDADQKVLDLIDGTRDLAEIARASRLGEFDATKLVFNLMQTGFVRVAPEREMHEHAAATEVVSHDRLGALVDLFNPYFSRVFHAAAGKGRDAALRRDLESFFRGSTGLADLFRGVKVSPRGTFSKEKLVENLEALKVPKKAEFLYQVLIEILEFLLFSAMETLDPKGEQELNRQAKHIFSM